MSPMISNRSQSLPRIAIHGVVGKMSATVDKGRASGRAFVADLAEAVWCHLRHIERRFSAEAAKHAGRIVLVGDSVGECGTHLDGVDTETFDKLEASGRVARRENAQQNMMGANGLLGIAGYQLGKQRKGRRRDGYLQEFDVRVVNSCLLAKPFRRDIECLEDRCRDPAVAQDKRRQQVAPGKVLAAPCGNQRTDQYGLDGRRGVVRHGEFTEQALMAGVA